MRAGACEALARTALVARHHDLGRRALAAARSPPRAHRRALTEAPAEAPAGPHGPLRARALNA